MTVSFSWTFTPHFLKVTRENGNDGKDREYSRDMSLDPIRIAS
jgi:hypothetical protein